MFRSSGPEVIVGLSSAPGVNSGCVYTWLCKHLAIKQLLWVRSGYILTKRCSQCNSTLYKTAISVRLRTCDNIKRNRLYSSDHVIRTIYIYPRIINIPLKIAVLVTCLVQLKATNPFLYLMNDNISRFLIRKNSAFINQAARDVFKLNT